MEQDPKQLAVYLSRGRAVLGLVMFALPSVASGLWLGAGARSGAAKALTRMTGARDLVLGIGTINALNETDRGADWLSMAAAADGADAVAATFGRGLPARARLVGLVAGVVAGVELSLARSIADEHERQSPSIPGEVEPAPLG